LKSEKKKKIILDEVEREIMVYKNYLEKKIDEKFSGILGIAIKKTAKVLFNWVTKSGFINRFKKNYEFLLDACEELNEREADISEIIKEKKDEYLSSNEIYLRANKKSEKIKKLEKFLLDEFKVRLKIYSRILSAEGENYDELVKNAFKEKSELEKLIKEEFKIIKNTLELISSEKDLIKIPSPIRTPILKIFSTSAEIMKEKMFEDIERIYKK
jgi:hypothetical protein